MSDDNDEERRAKRRAYDRAYTAKNKDRRLAIQRASRAKHREAQNERRRTPEHRLKLAEYKRRYRTTHPVTEKEKTRAREYAKEWRSRPGVKERLAAEKRRYRLEHPEANERVRAWRLANPERRKRAIENEIARRRSEQETKAGRPRASLCEICGGTERVIVFDHCHKHGHFRGWICSRCNTVLGHAEDDASLLLKMAAYLKRTQINTSPQLTLPGL